MKILILVVMAATVLGGCASNVTVGQSVYITPSDSSHLPNCEMLGQVEVDASIRWKYGYAEVVAEIKNRLRDATASKYPTADTVTHSDISAGAFKGPEGNVMGTAFKCFD